MNYENYIIGKTIRIKRENLGISKNALSKLVGISATEIRRIENGIRKSYNMNILGRICEVLDINLEELLFEIPKKYELKYEENYNNYDVKVIQTLKNIKAKNIENLIDIVINFLINSEAIIVDPDEIFELEVYQNTIKNEKEFSKNNSNCNLIFK